MTTSVTCDRLGAIAHIRLNRPDRHNAVNLDLAEELARSLRDAAADPEVGALLISGEGPSFCVGGDLHAMADADEPAELVRRLAHASNLVVELLHRSEKPVVVAAHGSVAGAGLGYVCAADIVVAADTTTFVSAFTAVALSPDSGVSWLLPRVVGLRRALELTLLNRRIRAEEALDWGLVNSVHPTDDVLTAAIEVTQALGRGPVRSAGVARALLRDSWGRGLEAQLEAEETWITELAGRPDSSRLIRSRVKRDEPPPTRR